MNNVLKSWKTSVVGLLFMSVALADVWHFEKMQMMAHGALAVVGVLLLFAPDKIINILVKKADKGS